MDDKKFLETQNAATEKAFFSVAEKHYFQDLGRSEMMTVFVEECTKASEVSNKKIQAPFSIQAVGNEAFKRRLLAAEARMRTRYTNALNAYVNTPMEVPEGIEPIKKPGKIKAFFKGIAALFKKHPIEGTSKIEDARNIKREIDRMQKDKPHPFNDLVAPKHLETLDTAVNQIEGSKNEVLVER